MPKVSLAVFDSLPRHPGYAGEEEFADPDVSTRVAFGSENAPIHLRLHDLPEGAGVRWENSRTGHLIYVWSGLAVIDGIHLGVGSTLVVEHHAATALQGGPGGATILVFNATEAAQPDLGRAGGRVHVLPGDRVPRSDSLPADHTVGGALFADSRCPTCELWLHETIYHTEDYVNEPHYHTEDEIIVVTGGEIVLGPRRYGPGTAVAVARNTIYSFKTGAGGLAFINFRPSRPCYARAGDPNPVDELSFYDCLAPPPQVGLSAH